MEEDRSISNLTFADRPVTPYILTLFGWMTGLEPATLGSTSRCSNQLSYNHHLIFQLRPKLCSNPAPCARILVPKARDQLSYKHPKRQGCKNRNLNNTKMKEGLLSISGKPPYFFCSTRSISHFGHLPAFGSFTSGQPPQGHT